MARNPYQPPGDDRTPPRHGEVPVPIHGDLATLARSHRGVNVAVLAYFGVSLLTAIEAIPDVVTGLAAIAVLLGGAVQVFRLAKALGGVLVAVTCTLLLWVPLVGLLVLLYLSRTGSKRLREAGYAVGLLGVAPGDLPR